MRSSQLAGTTVLKLDNVSVTRGGKNVLHRVSICVAPGRTLAVVGESGAGKSTLIAAILGLVHCTSGKLSWDQAPVTRCRPALVMQEPRSAFNPYHSLRKSVSEPLLAQRKPVDINHLNALCQQLEVSPALLDRRPAEVSIGQVQRFGILRALLASSPLVLFDEPLSALDAVTQKHTAQLIAQLQKEQGFAALIVTHDLGYAAAYADDIAVLRAGQIEEMTSAEAYLKAPQTAYGRTLLNAAMSLGALEATA